MHQAPVCASGLKPSSAQYQICFCGMISEFGKWEQFKGVAFALIWPVQIYMPPFLLCDWGEARDAVERFLRTTNWSLTPLIESGSQRASWSCCSSLNISSVFWGGSRWRSAHQSQWCSGAKSLRLQTSRTRFRTCLLGPWAGNLIPEFCQTMCSSIVFQQEGSSKGTAVQVEGSGAQAKGCFSRNRFEAPVRVWADVWRCQVEVSHYRL